MVVEVLQQPAPNGKDANGKDFQVEMRPPRFHKRKDTIHPSQTPLRIESIKFGIMSSKEIASAAQIEVNNTDLYDAQDRSQTRGGALDPRLGAISKRAICETCQESLQDCIGHFGYIRLCLPVFHPGYFKAILNTLQMICKHCSHVMLTPIMRLKYVAKLRNPTLSAKSHIRGSILREVWTQSKKMSLCPYCDRANGTVKKTAVLKIVHYPADNKPPSKKKDEDEEDDEMNEGDEDLILVDPAFHEAAKKNPDLRKHIPKAADDMHPLRALQLFEKIPAEDVQLLDMDPEIGRPERMLIQYLPVPPLCIRPTVCSDPSAGSTEDDLTVKAAEIVQVNSAIAQLMEKGGTTSTVFDAWDQMQYEVARYINSDQPGLPMVQGASKPLRGICQRLKGKTGRFRGNLSGKRVDFSGRTVISPDPNLRVDQVGVPQHVARVLTYPERVTKFNIELLRKMVRNGTEKYPGANHIEYQDGSKKFLKYGDRKKIAKELSYGTIVERHLIDGDIVLFNRQPSLHRISIMAHRVKISPHRTFRFNECVCAPYNADFDGDEMNLHVPQTQEARTEALELMGVVNNIMTPKNGEPLVAATQDFITSSYLSTRKDVFMDRSEFTRVLATMSSAEFSLPLPQPAIQKPMELWTGKQLFTVLIQSAALSAGATVDRVRMDDKTFTESAVLRPSLAMITTEVPEKGYSMKGSTGPLFDSVMCPKDAYVCFRGGELMCGQVGKKALGDGSKKSVLYILARECGNDAAAYAMNRLARFSARWLTDGGFSIGVDDVSPSLELQRIKARLVNDGYEKCQEFIEQLRVGKLAPRPGCSPEQTLEAVLNKELSNIRDVAGKACLNEIDVRTNAALTMALAGSKGSTINISQMISCVGQQTVGGGRAPDGFFGRALPHFELGLKARSPVAKGFVSNSFFSGMKATEFFMHAQSGREGLTDTAVKTAETGYMQRRLVKALEDLSVQYDSTVRSSSGSVVQVRYGDDDLDPIEMEDPNDGKPVHFARLLEAVVCSMKDSDDPMLSPDELRDCTLELIRELSDDLLESKLLPSEDEENRGGLAHCIKDVEEFLLEVADKQDKLESTFGLRRTHVKEFLRHVQAKVRKATVEPGTAVGAISAQSIGEPGTQMTLKTFHFAGVASMNITLGVPRLKEIINASSKISTPIITAPLVSDREMTAARIVKGRVQRTLLGEIAMYIKEVYRADDSYLAVRLDRSIIDAFQLDVDIVEVARRIVTHSFSKIRVKPGGIVVIRPDKLRIQPARKAESTKRGVDGILRLKNKEARKKDMESRPYFLLQTLKHQLPNVAVCGIGTVSRAVISESDSVRGSYHLAIESDDIGSVMTVSGVDGPNVTCNHIMAVEKTLGIESAR